MTSDIPIEAMVDSEARGGDHERKGYKVIESRFKNMNELRDLIDMDPRKGLALGRWRGADA